MPIKFIYFDLGGVLFIDLMVSNRWQEFVERLGVPNSLKYEFNNLYDKYEPLFNVGKMHTDEFVAIVADRLNLKLKTSNLLLSLVDEFYPNESLQGLLPKIQKQYRTGLLTNMYIGMLDEVFNRRLVSRDGWEIIIDSSKVGMAKPDRPIFEFAQKQAKVPPENILFIDNSSANIKAATGLGWQTLLYEPADIEGSNNLIMRLLFS